MIPDSIISITRDETMGLHPPYGKIYIRKVKYMGEKYPETVCFDCLKEACEDTETHEGRIPKWSSLYTSYTMNCDVCGEFKECTEPRDAGYPTFDYAIARIRAKKINKITKK